MTELSVDQRERGFPADLDTSKYKSQLEFELFPVVELSRLIGVTYSKQLEMYSAKKREKGICKGYSDRELISNMLAFVLHIRKLDKFWKKLLIEKEIEREMGSWEGKDELDTLTNEFRFADMNGMKYVWRNPSIPEFYLQMKRIAEKHSNHTLYIVFGRNALGNYTYEGIREKYLDSILNPKNF